MISQSAGMTFMEIMLVVSLIGMVSIALYQAFANGMKVWEKSREMVVEEDIIIFFDKFAQDLRNTFVFSTLPFEGDSQRFSFPSLVRAADMKKFSAVKQFKEQMGRVEYYYDPQADSLNRKVANYSQALNRSFEEPQMLVAPIERIQFRYYYLTDDGELFSEQVLEVIPSGVEVVVIFSDQKGTRQVQRYFAIPLKI